MRPPPRPFALRVTVRIDYPHGWYTLRLQRPRYCRWWPLPRFRSGQSIALALPGSHVRRHYSLARWQPLPFYYEVTIKREPQGRLSNHLFEQAVPGATVLSSVPGGDFVLPAAAPAERLVLIAGGVGITPLLAMIEQWRRQPSAFASVHLYWQVREPQEGMYRELLERYARELPTLHLRLLASRPASGKAERLTVEILQQELAGFTNCQFLMCAPPAMLDAFHRGLLAAGVVASAIQFERFAVAASGSTGDWQLQLDARSIAFMGHRSVLDALEDSGITLAADCRSGNCGQCRLKLLAGEAKALVAPGCHVGADELLACCYVPQSNLTLARIDTR
ncbi:MAG: 2Fe-2S iron-sulfur cluster-binding protein [Permianibacter sp.]